MNARLCICSYAPTNPEFSRGGRGKSKEDIAEDLLMRSSDLACEGSTELVLSLDRVKKDFFCIERSCLVRAGSEKFEGSSYVMALLD